MWAELEYLRNIIKHNLRDYIIKNVILKYMFFPYPWNAHTHLNYIFGHIEPY